MTAKHLCRSLLLMKLQTKARKFIQKDSDIYPFCRTSASSCANIYSVKSIKKVIPVHNLSISGQCFYFIPPRITSTSKVNQALNRNYLYLIYFQIFLKDTNLDVVLFAESYSEPCQIYKMKHFAKIVNALTLSCIML